MSIQSKRWQVVPPVSEEDLSKFPDVPPLLVQLLHNRGLNDPAGAREFLEAQAPVHSPFALKGMYPAVERLSDAISNGESIAVYGDFDADGVTATALLVEALSALGAQVMPYIPSRVDEGYGLNIDALRKLYLDGVRLVVTVDCGIRSLEEVEQASRGLDLIVTDHHSVGDQLPPALAVINPKQLGCYYPFKLLSGVGVAYKLAQALFYARERRGHPADLAADDLLDLVALGTVADLVPLLGENRALVRRGLEKMRTSPRPGVEALMADASVRRDEVDATAIGFRLGPRLNAAGRLDQVMLAYDLLTTTDPLETRRLAQELGKLNQHRQELTRKTVEIAEKQVRDADLDAFLYLVASAEFEPGIVGLAASRLTEAHYRPSVVVEMGKEYSRGSCRSIPEFHITRALDQCQDLLVRHGGHAAAAGFTVETAKLEALRERLHAIAAEQLAGADLQPVLEIDRELPLAEVTEETRKLLEQLEPTGMENPQPVLCSPGVVVRHQRTVGGDKHLKMILGDERGASWDAIWFRAGHLLDDVPARVDVAYTLEVDRWNHSKQPQLHVVDMRAAQGSSVAEEDSAYAARPR
ncbi:MAG: single-stranded-DNA-specific exonuclease RecJ [Anaerolineae bacterium]